MRSTDRAAGAAQKRLPRYPAIPAILLDRLAVATAAKRQGLGTVLLGDAITRADESGIGA